MANTWVYSEPHKAMISLSPDDLQMLSDQKKAEAQAKKEQQIQDFSDSLRDWYIQRQHDRERTRQFALEMLEARRAAIAGTETSETFLSQTAIHVRFANRKRDRRTQPVPR